MSSGMSGAYSRTFCSSSRFIKPAPVEDEVESGVRGWGTEVTGILIDAVDAE